MKNSDLTKIIILVLSFVILFSTSALAWEEGAYKNIGSIMKIDSKKNTMIINERVFVWNQKTTFYDDKGAPLGMDQFQPKSWVYVKGTSDQNNTILIEKLYLLPKYVGKKEKNRYPFME